MFSFLKNPYYRWRKQRLQPASFAIFKGHQSVAYAALMSRSTGCEWSDYALLRRLVLERKPTMVMEFGCGVSTIVLAEALRDAQRGYLTSYEEFPTYRSQVETILRVSHLESLVTLMAPGAVEGFCHGYLGRCYTAALPPVKYDLIFVDGPTEFIGPHKGICLDLFGVLDSQPQYPCLIVFDGKRNSWEAYRRYYRQYRWWFDPVLDVGFGEVR